jgi:propanediol dehydratase small subunit
MKLPTEYMGTVLANPQYVEAFNTNIYFRCATENLQKGADELEVIYQLALVCERLMKELVERFESSRVGIALN